jgi:hypothetical protein
VATELLDLTPGTTLAADDPIPVGDRSGSTALAVNASKMLKVLSGLTDDAAGVRTDLDLPTATATTAALALKANLASPTFTGTVTVPAPPATSNTTIPATTAFVRTSVGRINVKNYGATGDAQRVTDGVCGSGSIVTSATANFTDADVGKVVFAIEVSSGLVRVPVGTIVSRQSATQITVSTTGAGSYTGLHLVWGTDDTAALQAAWAASLALSSRPELYHPAGGYLCSSRPYSYSPSVSAIVPSITGDGSQCTLFYRVPTTLPTADEGMFYHLNGNCTHGKIQGMRFEGSYWAHGRSGVAALFPSSSALFHLDDVEVGYMAGAYCVLSTVNYLTLERCKFELSSYGLSHNYGAMASYGCVYTNNAINVLLNNSEALLNIAPPCRFFGDFIDESSQSAFQLNNSTEVSLFGCRIYAGPGVYALTLTNSSSIKMYGCEVAPYNANANAGGVSIASGCTVSASGTRFQGVGTRYAMENAGTFNDLGGNQLSGTGYTGAGVVVADSRRKPLTADVTVANSTLANITGLSVSVPAEMRISGRYTLFAADATAGDGIKFDLDGGSATWTSIIIQYRLTDGNGVTTVSRASAIATDATVATFTNPGLVEIEFSGVVNAAGTLIPRVAKNSGSTGNVTVSTGSNIVVDQMA